MARRDYKARHRRAVAELVDRIAAMEIPLDDDPDELLRKLDEELGPLAPLPPLPPHVAALHEEVAKADFLVAAGCEVERPKIARFEASKRIGRGGYGLVYLARDPELDRFVALKLCPTLRPEAAEVFTREAQLLGRFSHPNVVTIHETGRHEGEFFYVMEYVPDSGADLIHEWEDWQELVAIYLDAATGLAAAHDEGVVHGDFKPANLLIGEDGRARVADFGLARLIDEGAPERDPRATSYRVGTLPYIAPEVLRGQPNDAKSDQWSFFVSLRLTLEGELPYKGSTPKQVLAAIEHHGPLMWKLAREVPAELGQIVCRGLRTNPDQRYADMHDVAAALRRLVRPPPPKPPAIPPPTTPPWGTLALAVAVALGAVLGTLGWVDMRERARGGDESPCALSALDGSAADLDPLIVDLCAKIRDNHLERANHRWVVERRHRQLSNQARVRMFRSEARTQTSPEEASAAAEMLAEELAYLLDQDTLIIARTFSDQAATLQRQNRPKEAIMAANSARGWLTLAADGLGEGYPGLQHIADQINRIAPSSD